MEKVWLTPTKNFNFTIYFENLTNILNIFYVINANTKFRANQMLFTIQYIKLFLMHNFKLQIFKI